MSWKVGYAKDKFSDLLWLREIFGSYAHREDLQIFNLLIENIKIFWKENTSLISYDILREK